MSENSKNRFYSVATDSLAIVELRSNLHTAFSREDERVRKGRRLGDCSPMLLDGYVSKAWLSSPW